MSKGQNAGGEAKHLLVIALTYIAASNVLENCSLFKKNNLFLVADPNSSPFYVSKCDGG